MIRSLLVVSALFCSSLSAQEPLAELFEAASQVTWPDYDESRRGEPAYEREYGKLRAASFEDRDRRLEVFLEAHAERLAAGEGLRFQAKALMLLQRKSAAAAPLRAFLEEFPDHEKADDAVVDLVRCLVFGTFDYDEALRLGKPLLEESPDLDRVGELKSALRYAESDYETWTRRESLIGQPLPAVAHEVVIGPPPAEQSEWTGRVTVLDFWATWCGPCNRALPDLKALKQRLGEDLRVVAITQLYGYATRAVGQPLVGSATNPLEAEREIELLQSFHENHIATYPVFVTPKGWAKETLGVRALPTVMVLDHEGLVRAYDVGAGSFQRLASTIEKLVEEARGDQERPPESDRGSSAEQRRRLP